MSPPNTTKKINILLPARMLYEKGIMNLLKLQKLLEKEFSQFYNGWR